MIRAYKRPTLRERGLLYIKYRALYALWVSAPYHLPYVLWVYLSCCASYAIWEKHDTEAYRRPDIIETLGRDLFKDPNEVRPFVWPSALAAPVSVFVTSRNEDGKLYIRRSVVLWSAVFSTGGLMILLWLTGKWPLPAPRRPVLEYYGIHPLILRYYQEYFEKTIARLDERGMVSEMSAVNDAGSAIREEVGREFRNLGYNPHPLHLAVQQYLCADPMFREAHRDKWMKTVIYEEASFDALVLGGGSDTLSEHLPYPPACRVDKHLILSLNLGEKEQPTKGSCLS